MEPNDFKQAALDYHSNPVPGKLSIHLTKSTVTQMDLSLAYSPGVAEPVLAIAKDPTMAYRYTAKGNLVAVITDGSAVLGLGNVGPLAGKPVMEGKAVLFKHFANIDVFDIEVAAESPEAFIDTVTRIAPTFGGINLEDIKAPECFEIERILRERLNIPVFHDDQHGTAIVVAAGLLNAVELQQKKIDTCKIVCVGAGAAGLATLNLLMRVGAKRENIFLVDSVGVVSQSRQDLNKYKLGFAQDTQCSTLADVMQGADVFIGVAKPNLLTEQMLRSMAAKPIIFALSNPDPEIKPELAHQIRQDLIIATGRSDYPNQINNVLCFPYIFRGALDVKATQINDEMAMAAVHALKDLAREPVPPSVLVAYSLEANQIGFGRNYIVPKPLDFRLCDKVAKAVAEAAIRTGVAQLIK